MPEVIDLLSSPLKSPQLPVLASPRRRVSRTEDVFTFHSDDFDFTVLSGELDFSRPSASKRRRLSPPFTEHGTLPNLRARRKSAQELSESDGLPDLWLAAKVPETQHSDTITFTSSAPELRPAKKKTFLESLELSDELPEDLFGDAFPSLSQPSVASTSRGYLSERTANLLANLGGNATSTALKKVSQPKRQNFRMENASVVAISVVDDIFTSSPRKSPNGRKCTSMPADAERSIRGAERVEARAGARATKEAEKGVEKERKRLEKEAKARDKRRADDIAEVNRKKSDKKTSTPEMILDLPRTLEGTSTGNQVEEYMKHLEVETNYCDDQIDLSGIDGSIVMAPGHIVKWRRKVNAEYNEDLGHWEPLTSFRVENEKHVLVYLTATDFTTIAAHPPSLEANIAADEAAMIANIDKHITYIQSTHQDCQPIYLIEGLTAWLRKNKTAKNRAYTAAVLSQGLADPDTVPLSQPSRSKKRKAAASQPLDLAHLDFDLAESLLLHLQLHPLRPLIHLTTSPANTAAWLKTFTEHISTIPYRRLNLTTNLAHASFCMESGQIRTGDTPGDTYIKMLQEVQRVTPSMAYGVASKWGNVKELVEGFRRHGSLMLEDVKKSANKDGAMSDRRLGQSVSRRLWKVFMGKDPSSTAGIA